MPKKLPKLYMGREWGNKLLSLYYCKNIMKNADFLLIKNTLKSNILCIDKSVSKYTEIIHSIIEYIFYFFSLIIDLTITCVKVQQSTNQ